MAKFEIYKRTNGEYHFNLKAGNGKVILTSEGYKKRDSCKKGIESVKKNSTQEDRYEMKTAKNKQMYFVLKASNGQVLGTSEMYDSEAGCKNGKESVMRNAPVAPVMELVEQ